MIIIITIITIIINFTSYPQSHPPPTPTPTPLTRPLTHPHSRNAIHFFWYSNNVNVHFRYVDQSIRCSGQFEKYNEQIQKFLHQRPGDVVQYITNNLREPYAQSVKRIEQVSELGIFTVDRKINVQLEDDSTYPHCDCSEWRSSRLPCKHFCHIFSCIPGWCWEKVTSMYRKSPLLNLDDVALNVTTTENQVPTDDMRRHPWTGHGYNRMYSATTTNLNPTFPTQKEGYDEGAADTL